MRNNLGRSKAYSCYFLHNVITLRKKQWIQTKSKQLKQDILSDWESTGFTGRNAVTETRTSLTFYGRRVEDS